MNGLKDCNNKLLQTWLSMVHTLKKFTKDGSSGTSATLEVVDDDGSRGPSITAIVGTASSSSNSLQ